MFIEYNCLLKLTHFHFKSTS